MIPYLELDKDTGNTIGFFGSSKSGKSTLMIKIVRKYFPNKDFITVFHLGNPQADVYQDARNRNEDHRYGNTIRGVIISDGFCEEVLRKEREINKNTRNHYNFLNVLDDVIDRKNDKILENCILTLRNSNISTVLVTQYAFLISKSNRANVNFVFLFNFNTDEAKESIIDTFCKSYFHKMGLHKDDYIGFYAKHTRDHNYFLINSMKGEMFISMTGDWVVNDY
jgi:GTPase SAR1 family protein